eukprot:augustus_masked-scaffold_2-processed-gene-3.43-mRNA-1 protein AED:1.00 eAED:1.00 QI:0/-1/0/0/-1/1/1/0/250
MEKIKVITFDLDDTLYLNKKVIQRATLAQNAHIKTHYPKLAAEFTPDLFREFYKKARKQFPDKLYDLNQTRKNSLGLVAEHFNLAEKDKDQFISSTFKVFDDERQLVDDHLFDDVLNVLEKLKSKGYILGSLTNGTAVVEKIPTLNELFQFNVTAIESGALKPDRKPFEKVLEKSNFSKEEILHIGDNPKDDVLGAVSYGFKTIWMCCLDQTVEQVKGFNFEDVQKNKLYLGRVENFGELLEMFDKSGKL